MRRNALHLAVDVVLFLTVLSLAGTGLLLAYVLPGGSGRATVWGWSRHDWGELHLWIALTMLVVALLHVALNWAWVCNVACKLVGRGAPRSRWRHLGGAALIAAIVLVVVGFLYAASSAKKDTGERLRRGPPASRML
jgi:hypothetical protein